MKFAGVYTLAAGAALPPAAAILIAGLDATGALKSVNDFASAVTGSATSWVSLCRSKSGSSLSSANAPRAARTELSSPR
jgi:hypothetical protein